MKIKENQIRKICMLITGSITVLILINLGIELFNEKGNHGILFGNWLNRVLFQYPIWIVLLFSFPMFIPFLLNRNLKNIKLAMLSIIAFVLFYLSFLFLTD